MNRAFKDFPSGPEHDVATYRDKSVEGKRRRFKRRYIGERKYKGSTAR